MMVGLARIQIMHTSDVHMHILPHDYFRDEPDANRGLARAKAVIDAARSEGTTLLFDTGDLIQGTAQGVLFAQDSVEEHPAHAAISVLGYDAVTLGNHDFNFGLGVAAKFYGDLTCPVVQSNISSQSGMPLFSPTLMLIRSVTDDHGKAHRLRIGILGVAPPQILAWDRDTLGNQLMIEDMRDAARKAAQTLRADGADLVIALAHTAPADGCQKLGAENRAHEIAALDGIDVVLAGHSHKSFPSQDYADLPAADHEAALLSGTPATMPGANASHIAKMELQIQKHNGAWQVIQHKADLITLADYPPDPALCARLQPQHDRTRRFINQQIAGTQTPISGAGFAFGFDAGQTLLFKATRNHVERQSLGPEPLIIATAPYRFASAPDGLCLPPGPISRRDLFTLYPFPNAISVLRVTGKMVKDWLEHAARLYAPQYQDVIGPLLDPSVPSYNFDTLHGLTYRIDPCADVGHRIIDLAHQGAALDPNAEFLLATTTYRANGGGGFPKASIVWTDRVPLTDRVQEYLEMHSPVGLDPSLGWELAPQENHAAIISLQGKARPQPVDLSTQGLQMLAKEFQAPYMSYREVGAGERLANPVRSGRKQP